MTTANYLFAVGMALSVVGPASPAAAQCAGESESGLCPIFIQGDPSCSDAARICATSLPGNVFLSPPSDGSFPGGGPPSPAFRIDVDVVGSTGQVRVIDISPQDQFNGTRGFEAAIVRRNGAYIYCGISILNDLFRSPGNGAPSQLTVCWARGPCRLTNGQVNNACNAINNDGRVADFLQTYDIGRIEQPINVCGCSPAIAQFCDVRAQDANEPTHFVACNPDGSPLKSTEAESIATEGLDSCIWMTIGGRRMLVDKDGTDPRC